MAAAAVGDCEDRGGVVVAGSEAVVMDGDVTRRRQQLCVRWGRRGGCEWFGLRRKKARWWFEGRRLDGGWG